MFNKNSKVLSGSLSKDFDFNIDVYKEQIENNGEDSYFFASNEDKNIQAVAVFDGCGGSGSRQYIGYNGRTGAYMASKAISGAAREWFDKCVSMDEEMASESLKSYFKHAMEMLVKYGQTENRIKGNIGKEFPSTAAMCVCREGDNGLWILSLWAGDSRCYMLTASGLKQLSRDDTGGIDAMEDLKKDGILRNVISASKDYKINANLVCVNEPCIVFTASDGCFGYLPSPMHFEYLLEKTLDDSSTPAEWEQLIDEELKEISGDDYSLSGIVLGFGTMDNLKKTMTKRTEQLWNEFISPFRESKSEDGINSLWRKYRPEYSEYMK